MLVRHNSSEVTLTGFAKKKNEKIKIDQICMLLLARPRGVTVSTLDSESSDRGSNPREA